MDRWPDKLIGALAKLVRERLLELPAGRRLLIGIAGPPAAGKSTLAEQLVQELNADHPIAQLLPMDGFHMYNQQLDSAGIRSRKGAPETFRPREYVRLLKLAGDGVEVLAPAYSRDLHDVVENALSIKATHRIVVTEGNYLLLCDLEWSSVASVLDLRIFVRCDEETARARLMKRHLAGGKTEASATEKVESVDLVNLRLINSTERYADWVVDPDGTLTQLQQVHF